MTSVPRPFYIVGANWPSDPGWKAAPANTELGLNNARALIKSRADWTPFGIKQRIIKVSHKIVK